MTITKNILSLVAVVVFATILQNCSKKMPEVFIISPLDGAQVESPFLVTFGASNVEIVPAGTNKKKSGHHHLLINQPVPDISKPMGGDVMHFGKGETEVQLDLPPGLHSLQLILGDMVHKPHEPPIVSKRIVILVKGKEASVPDDVSNESDGALPAESEEEPEEEPEVEESEVEEP